MLETDGDTSEELITFHVKMLRKLKKSVSMDKWEKVLTRYIAVIACLAAIISLIPSVLSRVSEPGYLAGAGAVTLVRLWLHLDYLFNNSRKLNGT